MPIATRQRRLLSALLAILLASTVAAAIACSTGGAGGGDPVPGSDEQVRRDSKRLDTSADAAMAAALKQVDRCTATGDQIAAVLNALAQKQQLGTNSTLVDGAAREGLRPAARSVGRAFVRGEKAGMTGEQLDVLARWAGLNTDQPGWMNDPDCEKNWIALVSIDIPGPPGIAARLKAEARVPLTIAANGAVSGNATMAVRGEMTPPSPCGSATVAPSSATITIGGQLAGGKFALKLSHTPITLDAKVLCDLPTGRMEVPSPAPFGGMTGFPISVDAKGSAQTTEPPGISVMMATQR